ncbi:hypothetical protein, partial [Ohtaekwangia sp.]|uniref:hypothetical protein n=1 Tax=Ohtaekwangia sp. TaxID=2066019 RepID=UPI002FDEE12D
YEVNFTLLQTRRRTLDNLPRVSPAKPGEDIVVKLKPCCAAGGTTGFQFLSFARLHFCYKQVENYRASLINLYQSAKNNAKVAHTATIEGTRTVSISHNNNCN